MQIFHSIETIIYPFVSWLFFCPDGTSVWWWPADGGIIFTIVFGDTPIAQKTHISFKHHPRIRHDRWAAVHVWVWLCLCGSCRSSGFEYWPQRGSGRLYCHTSAVERSGLTHGSCNEFWSDAHETPDLQPAAHKHHHHHQHHMSGTVSNRLDSYSWYTIMVMNLNMQKRLFKKINEYVRSRCRMWWLKCRPDNRDMIKIHTAAPKYSIIPLFYTQ